MATRQTHHANPQAACPDTVERLSMAMETAAVGMWEWKPEEDTLFFDDRYYTMAGYTPGEFAASIEAWGERVHPEDLQDVREGLYQLARGEADINQREFRFKTGSGEWMWILGRGRVYQRNAAGRPTWIIGTHIDITDLRQAESKRRRIHAHFERVLEKSHAGILIAQDGIVRFANPSLTEMTGYAAHELNNRPLVEIIHPTDRDMVMDRHVRRLRGESLPEYYTLRCITKDGTALWLEMNTIIFEWLDRPAILCFLRDVTFTKTMERQILQAQKMQAIGTLAGGIAHDFNNIVSAIMGYTEICLMEAPEGSRTAKRLSQVIQASQRAGELVNQILAFSRQEEADQKPINPSVVVKEVMKLIRASIPASVVLEKRIDGDAGPVMADPTRIHQVVMNLCTNAAHAMRETGGVLRVALTACEVDDDGYTATIRGLIPGEYVCLTVSDTGYGIDPTILKKIFDPYFTTKIRGEGTGLGLSVVHGIVTQLGGAVTVYSEPGKGTTFNVYLPKIAVDEDLSQVDEKAPITGGNETILIVDDDGVLLEMTQEMLEGFGYRVFSRASSLEAIQAFRSNPGRFDLVITDQSMPGMSGIELAAEIGLLSSRTPVILCSGFNDGILKKRIASAGIRTVLKKPILRRELAAAVRGALDGTLG